LADAKEHAADIEKAAAKKKEEKEAAAHKAAEKAKQEAKEAEEADNARKCAPCGSWTQCHMHGMCLPYPEIACTTLSGVWCPLPDDDDDTEPDDTEPACTWETGDGLSTREEGFAVTSKEDCVEQVKQQHPSADGATVTADGHSCWAEFGWTGADGNNQYQTCKIGELAPSAGPEPQDDDEALSSPQATSTPSPTLASSGKKCCQQTGFEALLLNECRGSKQEVAMSECLLSDNDDEAEHTSGPEPQDDDEAQQTQQAVTCGDCKSMTNADNQCLLKGQCKAITSSSSAAVAKAGCRAQRGVWCKDKY